MTSLSAASAHLYQFSRSVALFVPGLQLEHCLPCGLGLRLHLSVRSRRLVRRREVRVVRLEVRVVRLEVRVVRLEVRVVRWEVHVRRGSAVRRWWWWSSKQLVRDPGRGRQTGADADAGRDDAGRRSRLRDTAGRGMSHRSPHVSAERAE